MNYKLNFEYLKHGLLGQSCCDRSFFNKKKNQH